MDAPEEVLQAANARAQALATADAEALTKLLHPDFRWVTHTGQTFDRDTYITRNTSGTVVWRSQRLSQVEVMVSGDAAVLHAEVTDAVATNDGIEEFQMPMTQVWVRDALRWSCLAGHAGPRRT
ncbi:MAG: nuclear transport factor 2 family protein [Nocardioides sp.]|uniref:nuclear transport factor 2 family protein n=1 Tax=Nocardioides sp. TaxID=35761 RepID=UPI0039E350F4